eukprot:Skav216376  [mRNA]  locus=scaffold3826:17829:20697:+ [translate_table: standard]
MSVTDGNARRSQFGLFLVYILVVFYALCFQLQSPLEPFLVEKLVGNDKSSDASVAYGRLQSLFSGIQMFASLLFGHILDKFGVRVGFTLNFLACAATYYLLSITSSMTMLYMSKIPGIGMAGFLCAQTAVSQLTSPGPERVQALGRLTSAYTIGGIVGPYLGGLLGAQGDYFLSAKLAMLGSLIAAACCLMLPVMTPLQDLKEADALDAKLSKEMPWINRMGTVIRLAGFLSGVKLITSTANSMASSTQNLILKNQLGFAEADLGFFMSAQFAFGAVANAVLLGPVTKLMGGALQKVVRNCVLGMAAFYALQSLLNSNQLELPPTTQKCSFIAVALGLAIFQYSLSTSITAENTQRVPENMKGTLIGMEHCIFSAARVATPAIGINVLNAYGMGGLYAACSSIFIGTFLLWNLTAEHFLPTLAAPTAGKKDRQLLPEPPSAVVMAVSRRHKATPTQILRVCRCKDALAALSRAYAGTGWGDDTADWEG